MNVTFVRSHLKAMMNCVNICMKKIMEHILKTNCQNMNILINQSNYTKSLEPEFILSYLILSLSLRYYFSTFEDDNLLCVLDDDGYSKDEIRFNVIPEQYNIDEELTKSFEEIL